MSQTRMLTLRLFVLTALALSVAVGATACTPSTQVHDHASDRDRASPRDHDFELDRLPDRTEGERDVDRDFDRDLDRNREHR